MRCFISIVVLEIRLIEGLKYINMGEQCRLFLSFG